MAYVQLNDSDRKRNMMADYEKIVNGLIDNPNCGYAMSDEGEFLTIVLRKPKQ